MTAPVLTRSAGAPARRRPDPVDAPARGADLRLVGEERRARPVGLTVAFVVVLVFGALFANAVFHAFLVTDQARLDQLNAKVATAQSLNEHEQLRVANLESPARIVSAAKGQGMLLPDQVHWIVPGSGSAGPTSSTSSRVTAPPDTTASSGAGSLAAGSTSSASTTVPSR
jgi:hypothetical protein